MDDIHVIVISSVRPEPSSGGQVILHRHLADQAGITLEVYGAESQRPALSRLIRRIAGRLQRTRLHRFIEDFWVLWDGRWIDAELPVEIEDRKRTVVLTVAHGEGFSPARRFAKQHRLPLVTFFHDWWPDLPQLHAPFRRRLERKFRALARDSAAAICVCEGMLEALGDIPNGMILRPIPAEQHGIQRRGSGESTPFKVVCSGNLFHYGPMLGDALETSLAYPEILLQVRGANPAWSEERKAKMKANGRWLDFAPRAELDAWLASANAFLVPMVFDPDMRRRMETSFPSKLIEFVQFGKPLVIWGPEYCSAVRWASNGGKAICVTDPNPGLVLNCLCALAHEPETQSRYGIRSRESAANEFDAVRIQRQFRKILEGIIR